MQLFIQVGGTILIFKQIFELSCFFAIIYLNFSLLQVIKILIYWKFGCFLFDKGFQLNGIVYTHLLIRKLKRAANFKEEIKVSVVDFPFLNAFAFKSGGILGLGIFGKTERHIAITTELLKFCTKKELDFIIAHEFAHHLKNHFIIGIIGKLINDLSFKNIFLNPSLQSIIISTVLMGVSAVVLRKQEKEADEIACRLLKNLQIGCNGGISFFKKLQKLMPSKKSKISKFIDFFFDDHPDLEERIENIRKLT